MKYRFIDEHRSIWPVRVMCRVPDVSASGSSAWRTRGESPRAKAKQVLLGTIRAIRAESGGGYGAPRVPAVLRSHGRRISRHRSARRMRGAEIARELNRRCALRRVHDQADGREQIDEGELARGEDRAGRHAELPMAGRTFEASAGRQVVDVDAAAGRADWRAVRLRPA